MSTKHGKQSGVRTTSRKKRLSKSDSNKVSALRKASTTTRSRQTKHEIYRIAIIFAVCQITGSFFYFICALKYSYFPRVMGTFISVIVQLVNCAMILFPLVRILMLLALPSLLTGRLRALLLVILFTWSVQFAAMNVTSNVSGTAEGIVCVQERVRALAAELRDSADRNLRQVPVQKIQKYLQRSVDAFARIREILRDLDDSLGNMMAWQRSMVMKMKEMLGNCSAMAQIPFHACISSFSSAHSNCLESMHELICAPIDILKYLCYMSKILELQCEWPKMMKNQMEEGVGIFVRESKSKAIDYAKNTMFYEFYAKGKDAKTAYETLELGVNHSFTAEQEVDFRAREFREQLRAEVGYIERFFSLIIVISDTAFIVVMALPFISAFLYMQKFQRKDDANNYFLSAELEALNIRQKANKKPAIFPLSYDEKKMYIRWTNMWIVAGERNGLVISLALTVLAVIVPAVFVLADLFTYKALSLGYEFFHSNDTRLSKPNVYTMKVPEGGFLSELFSSLLNTFEPMNRDSMDRDSMWHACFNEPNPPDYKLFKLMLLMFIFSIMLCLLQVYAKRLQHKIALFYFPHRCMPRVVYLYNSILEARYKRKLAEESREDPLLYELNDISLSISSSSSSSQNAIV